jgi:hypothetical protein
VVAWRPDEGEGGLASHGQLGCGDGPAGGEGGIIKAYGLDVFDVFPAVNSMDIFFSSRHRLQEFERVKFERWKHNAIWALDRIGSIMLT